MLSNLDNEVIFKKAFTDKIVFTRFVKDILNIDFKVDKIETEKQFTPKVGNIDFKYDIFAESADHRIIVEIQRLDYDYGFDRFLHYHLMAIAERQRSSKDYKIEQQIHTIVMLSAPYKVNNFSGLPIVDEVLVSDLDPRNLDDKKAEIFPHKLIFLNPNYTAGKVPRSYRDWLDLVYESIHHPKNYKVNEKNNGIKRAVELIDYDNLTGAEREKMKIAESRKNLMTIVKKEEREEGREEGEKSKAVEIAKNLLKNDVDIGIIINSTGLTIEEIERLK